MKNDIKTNMHHIPMVLSNYQQFVSLNKHTITTPELLKLINSVGVSCSNLLFSLIYVIY